MAEPRHGIHAAQGRPRRRSRISLTLAIAVFLIGVGMTAYPYVSDYLSKLSQAHVVARQRETVASAGEDRLAEERRRALDYNRRLLTSRSVVTDPFDPSVQTVSNEEYWKLMNLAGDGVMGSIVIPKLRIDMPIYHGTDDAALQHGAGHLVMTSLPYGGPSSHAVLAGHNGLPTMRVFDDLHKLKKGDWFILQVLGEDHAYRVTGIETVLPEKTDSLDIQEGRDLVTLVTCTPYGVNTHRLLVHAERCAVPKEWTEWDSAAEDTAAQTSTPLVIFTLAGLGLGLLILVAWAARHRVRR